LCDFPVVILTSSLDERDREDTTKFPNVKDYINKPLSYEKILEIQKKLSSENGVNAAPK
jgi:response regulator RpfG family c-di-GMP phosphodiesterase